MSPRDEGGRWSCTCDATIVIHAHCDSLSCPERRHHVIGPTWDRQYTVSLINTWPRHILGPAFLADLCILQCAACGVVHSDRADSRAKHARSCVPSVFEARTLTVDPHVHDGHPIQHDDSVTQPIDYHSDTDADRTAPAAADPHGASQTLVVAYNVDESPRRDEVSLLRNGSVCSEAATEPIPDPSPARSSTRRRRSNVSFSDEQAQADELARHQRAHRRRANSTHRRTQSRERSDEAPPVNATHRYTLSDVFSVDEPPKLYNAARVLDRVPEECIPQWIAAARAHLLAYQHHRASDDAEAATNALWAFFTLPVRTLQAARTGRRRRRQAIRAIHRRLSSVIAEFDGEEGFARRSNVRIRAEVTGRCRSTIALDGCPAVDDSQSSDERATSASIRRAIHLASNGYLGRASHALKHF